jgi:hypothetical protein
MPSYLSAVSSTSRARALVNKMKSTRVSIEMFGDSNMGQDTGGHWSSWAIDLRDRAEVGVWGQAILHYGYGGFGSDLRGLGVTGGDPSGIGLKRVETGYNSNVLNRSIFTNTQFESSIAADANAPITASGETPVAWARYYFRCATGLLVPLGDDDIDGTSMYNVNVSTGVNKLFGDGTTMNTTLYHTVYIGASGIGTTPIFNPAIRGQNGPVGSFATTLYTAATGISTTGVFIDYTLKMAATNGESQDRQFQYNRIAVNRSRGEFFAGPAQWARDDKTVGVAVSPTYAAGGRTLRNVVHDMVSALRDRPLSIQEQLRFAVRAHTPGQETVCIVNKMKGNDVGDANNAWVYAGGTATQTGSASNTKEGYKQNLNSFIRMWTDAWVALGYNTDNLFFIDGAYHPQPTGGYTAIQEEMSTGASELAADGNSWTQNLIVINGNDLTTSDEMTALDWYKPADTAHLTTAGFDGFNGRELDALFEAAEYTDYVYTTMYKASTVIRFGGVMLKL